MPASSSPPSAASALPRRRLAPLDGLRAAVVLGAFFHFDRLQGVLPPLEGLYKALLRAGSDVGMETFFVLSGLLITGILLDTRGDEHYFRTFYARRFLRIFPVYYGFLATWLLVLPRLLPELHRLFDTAVKRQFFYWTYSMNLQVLLPRRYWFAIGTNHLWSLMVEEQFYLIWPLVVRLAPLARLRTVAWGLIVLSPCLRAVIAVARPDVPIAGYNFALSHCEGLAFGSLLALDARSPEGLGRWRRRAGWIAVVGVAVTVATFAWTGLRTPAPFWSREPGITIYVALGGALVIGAVTASPGALGVRLLSHPVLTTIGRYSYAIYVLHWPLSILLDALHLADLPAFAGWIPASRLAAQIAYSSGRFLAAFLLAALCWHLFEKRLLALKRHWPYDFERAATPLARAADSAPGVG